MKNFKLNIIIKAILLIIAVNVTTQSVRNYDLLEFYPQCATNIDMGMCSASWAIVLAKAMSMSDCINNERVAPLVFSPQVLVDCVSGENPCNEMKQNWDFMTGSQDYLKDEGINTTSDMEYTSYYTGVKGNCNGPAKNAHKIQSYTKLENTADAVKNTLMQNNPVVVILKLQPSYLIMTSGKQSNSNSDGSFDYGYQAILITGFREVDDKNIEWQFTSSWNKNWGFMGNGKLVKDVTEFEGMWILNSVN